MSDPAGRGRVRNAGDIAPRRPVGHAVPRGAPRDGVDVLYGGTASTKQRPSAAELLGVPLAPKTARDRLVATATNLCYREGFNAVGLDRILAEAKVAKTTFYKHFESREDLLVAVVQQRDEWESAAWSRAIAALAPGDAAGQLLAMFDVLDRWFNDPQFGGCLFINTVAEFPNPNDPIHRAAAAHKRRVRDSTRDLAREAGVRDPELFADEYILILEGTLVMRLAHDRNDAAQVARRRVERMLAEEAARSRKVPAAGSPRTAE